MSAAAGAFACVLLIVVVQTPTAGAPLWTLAPRYQVDLDFVWESQCAGATLEWSPVAAIAAVADDTEDIMAGVARLPMTSHEIDVQVSAVTADDAAVLDAMEADLHVALDALVIIACAVLDVAPCDAALCPSFGILRKELSNA